MEESDLTSIGFSKNEAHVYMSLIKFYRADANTLIKDTKFHKNIVYDNLDKLMNKGLITYITENNKRIYKISDPKMLLKIFEEEEENIRRKKIFAEKISRNLTAIVPKKALMQEASIYRGVKSIKSFYEQTLQSKEYCVFGAPIQSIRVMQEHFWKNYTLKRIEKKIKVRMIFNTSLRKFGQTLKNKFTFIRFFDNDFESLTETHIQDDRVAIIVWSTNPILFLIEEKYVAASYQKYFEKMWREAKN
jgi:sugar-specific transcriptional regulator TrmB